MKTIEKLFIGIILLLIFGVFVFGSQYGTLFIIFNFFLSICYFFGGFYFFNENESSKLLNITSGLILGVSLAVLSFSLWVPISTFRKSLVIINVIYLIGLVISWFYRKHFFNKNLKCLFFRSFAIAIVTSFMSFSSPENRFYRKVILKMTPSDSKLYSNFMMFDKIDDYKSLKKNENYEKAIRAIKEALLYGKKWVENDTLQYQEFSGVYEFLSDVYIDNGNYFYIKNDFKKALLNYIRADSILTHKEFVPKYPKVIKSDVYWNRYNMMLTYDKLLDYENYDIELDYLLDNYSKIKDTIDLDYHRILNNASNNYTTRLFYDDAIHMDEFSLEVLRNDSINNLEELKGVYIRLIKNYSITDNIVTAKAYLRKYEKIKSSNDCIFLFYSSQVYQKESVKKGLKYAKESYSCFDTGENLNNIFFSSYMLAMLELLNSNLDSFEKQIAVTQDMLQKVNDQANKQSLVHKLLGNYNSVIGNYKESKLFYQKSLEYEGGDELPSRLKIAYLNDELAITYDKETINASALDYLSKYEKNFPSLTNIHNDLGNINIGTNISLSDSVFNVTIETHEKFNVTKSPEIGIAYNGLASNKLYKKHFKEADSLFNIAIRILDEFYGENQNINQLLCYRNIIESKLDQKKYSQGLYYLKKAEVTKENCFRGKTSLHDAYLLKFEGDIGNATDESEIFSKKKYREALRIAKMYLDKSHWFIVELESKLK